MHELHGQYINESDFTEESKEAYEKFVELYIKLYYAPLDEGYDEMRYFTKEYDKNMFNKLKWKRSKLINSIELK